MWSRRFGRPNQIHESTGKITMNFDRIPLSDRKSTRLNSSHVRISYAVFCLKKKSTFQKDVSCEPGIFDQLITLPTYHTSVLPTYNLDEGFFAADAMLAYVKGV